MAKKKTNRKPKQNAEVEAPAEMQAAPIIAYADSLSAAAAKARGVVPHLVWARSIDEDTGAAIMLLAAHADSAQPDAPGEASDPEADPESTVPDAPGDEPEGETASS